MAEVKCPNEDKYNKDGRCCDYCPAGSYKKADCNASNVTHCEECGHGHYTATKNHLGSCQVCRDCSSLNNLRTVTACTSQKNTECECLTGFYCSDDQCEHCRPVNDCPLGYGVKVKAIRTNNTICAPCEDGTYSNVTDFHSACQTHTRCEDYGRVLKIPGTSEADAVCGNFKNCPWILPAGLWSGLVLTVLVLFVFMCWREKRKSYRPASPIIPVTVIEVVPEPPNCPPHMPLPTTELKSYCQESCTEDGCTLPIFNPEDNVVSDSTQDSVDSCPPITPLKVSMSFTESGHMNGSAGYSTCNFLRTFSEPQEDEWCGT